jgi:signal transduction histidine kinase
MNQPNVLVIADNKEFAQSLMSRWHSERTVPAFTVMNSEVISSQVESCDLIIVGNVDQRRFLAVIDVIGNANQPAIVVASDAATALRAHGRSTRPMILRQHEGWEDLLILLAPECMRRLEMSERAQRAEAAAAELAAHATLGRYMIEMRHGLNNALTSVLGNAELLLMEPDSFSPEVREQLVIIRSMSLRMNEIIARFSSLETELTFAKRESHGESAQFVRNTAPGWSSF